MDEKVKVKGRPPKKTVYDNRRQNYRKPSFEVPTPGLGGVYFSVGKDLKAGRSQETDKKLSRYVAMPFKMGAADAVWAM